MSDHLSVTSRVVAYERFHCTVFDDELAAVTASFVSFVLKLVRNPTTSYAKRGPHPAKVQNSGSEDNVDGQYEEVRREVGESAQKPRKNNGHGAPDEYAVVDKSKKKKVRVLVSGRLTQTVYNFCLFVCLFIIYCSHKGMANYCT